MITEGKLQEIADNPAASEAQREAARAELQRREPTATRHQIPWSLLMKTLARIAIITVSTLPCCSS